MIAVWPIPDIRLIRNFFLMESNIFNINALQNIVAFIYIKLIVFVRKL